MKQISLFFALMLGTFMFGQQTFTETFEGIETSDGFPGASYSSGSFTGTNGNQWVYGEARNQDTFSIDGNGILLRRASDSYLSTTLTNVQTFSFQYRKAYTGANPRQIEVLLDGEPIWLSPVFGDESGNITTVHTATIDVNHSGTSTITIKNVGSTTTNRHFVVDNITWVEGEDDTDPVDPTEGLALDYVNDLRTQQEYNQLLADGFEVTDGVSFQTAAGGYVRFGLDDAIVSPLIDVNGVETIEVEFDLATFGTGSNRVVYLNVKDANGNMIQEQSFFPESTTYITGTTSINVLSYNYVQFEVTMTSGSGSVRFRDLSITATEMADVCITPNNLELDQIGATSAHAFWIPGGTETAWQIVYGEEGIIPYDEDAITVTSPEYMIEGLDPETVYDVYVRAVCGTGDYSNWVLETFTTASESESCGISATSVEVTFESPFVAWFDIPGAPAGQRYDLAAGEPGFTPNNPNFGMANVEMPYRRNSMHQGRTYEFYVRVIGENGEVCDWVGPIEVIMPSVGTMAARATMYPNPARTVVTIEGTTAEMVQIFNNAGAVISTQKVVNNQFDVNTLPAGTYVIQITDADGNVSAQQLMKK